MLKNQNAMNISFLFRLLLFCAGLCLVSCQPATPEKSFDVAVLNTNMLVGFANDGLWRELQSPAMKMGKTKDDVVPMPRSEVIAGKLKFAEENLEKIQALGEGADARDIVQSSLALHRYIIPVYKNEYTQLAKLMDSGAPKAQIDAETQAIQEKYFPKFEALYGQLIAHGKAYAQKHNLNVKWLL